MRKYPSTLILHTKVLLSGGIIVEAKIWRIVGDSRFPDEVKYSLFAVYDGETLVGYDNHHPKGHHRHIGSREEAYNYTSIETLRNDFRADLELELAKRGLG
jgi:hypothetical protein